MSGYYLLKELETKLFKNHFMHRFQSMATSSTHNKISIFTHSFIYIRYVTSFLIFPQINFLINDIGGLQYIAYVTLWYYDTTLGL